MDEKDLKVEVPSENGTDIETNEVVSENVEEVKEVA